MAIPRPRGKFYRLWHSTAVADILIAVFAVGTQTPGVAKLLSDSHPWLGWTALSGMFAILMLSIRKGFIAWGLQSKKESPHELEGCLRTLHALLVGDQPHPRLRLTIHAPVDDRQKLQQVLPYVGVEAKDAFTAPCFPVQSGIIGMAYREKKPYHFRRTGKSYEEYIQELVTKWHYSEEDARKRDPSTMAWVAVPIINDNKVLGIVYVDSIDANFFTTPRVEIIGLATIGIARFVKRRYD